MKIHRSRRGAMLLEVLLTCFLFGMSLTVLSNLSHSAHHMTVVSDVSSQSLARGESVLTEIMVGASDLPRGPIEFQDDPDWMWAAFAGQADSGLWHLRVRVWRRGRLKEASLVELVRLMPESWRDASTILSNASS